MVINISLIKILSNIRVNKIPIFIFIYLDDLNEESKQLV